MGSVNLVFFSLLPVCNAPGGLLFLGDNVGLGCAADFLRLATKCCAVDPEGLNAELPAGKD